MEKIRIKNLQWILKHLLEKVDKKKKVFSTIKFERIKNCGTMIRREVSKKRQMTLLKVYIQVHPQRCRDVGGFGVL